MAALYDRVKVAASAAPGVGAFPIGAAVPGYRTLADAGVGAGVAVSYVIEDGTSWEIGHGICTSDGHVNRSAVIASSAGGITPITASSAAVLFLTPLASDLVTVTTGNPTPYTGRYWRLGNIVTNGAGYSSFAELTFYDQSGNPLTPVAATAGSSPFGAGEGPAMAYDGNINTQWTGQTYLEYDFGTDVTPASYKVTNRADGNATYNSLSWTLFYGENDAALTSINTVTNPAPNVTSGVSTFTIPVNPAPVATAAQLVKSASWRMRIISSNSPSYLSAFEIQFRTAIGVSTPMSSVGGTGTTTHTRSGFDQNAWNDGDITTRWALDDISNVAAVTFEWTFASPVAVLELAYLRGNSETPNSFAIEAQNTDGSWATIKTITGYADSAYHQDGSTFDTFAVQGSAGGSTAVGAPVKARYWRIADLYPVSGSYVGTGELQFFDVSGALIHAQTVTSNGNDTDPLANINDGNLGTYWTSSSIGHAFAQFDFGSAVQPASFLISARNGLESCNIAQMILRASADGLRWQDIAMFTPTWTGADNETRTIPIAENAAATSTSSGSTTQYPSGS